IAPDQQERIFEAFYRSRGHSASADQVGGDHSGAGLGLALARWLVTVHDGDISVRSAPGAGSVFTVSLPLLADYRADTADDAITEEDQPPALADTAPTSDL
ncbi:MAG: sensor histidine kinase, partial [Ktedonobacterales bacterium]